MKNFIYGKNYVKRDIFGSNEIVFECLYDKKRTSSFFRAIKQIVKKGFRVLEAGIGTGCLSLMALRAGAKDLTALEIVAPVAKLAFNNIKQNGYDKNVTIVIDDATKIKNDYGKFDVLIMEMISVGLIEEMQVGAFNNLLEKGFLKKDSKMIPSGYETFFELVETEYDILGNEMKMVQHLQLWEENPIKKILSKKCLLWKVNFNEHIKLEKAVELIVEKKFIIKIARSGKINGIKISGVANLTKDIDSGWTIRMNAPAVVPVDNEVAVKKNDKVSVTIKYELGGEFKNFYLSIKKI